MTGRVIIMREAIVRLVKLLSDKNVPVTQRGSRAFVEYNLDGSIKRVNIPYLPDDASDELLNAVQGFLDHEVAHILFTDFSAIKLAKKFGVASLHNIIEDSFIERKMAEQFAGSGLNLRNVGEFFLKSYTTPELEKETDPDKRRGILLVPAVRAWAGQHVFQDFMKDRWGELANVSAALGDAVKEVAECKTSHDCLTLAKKFKELMSKPSEPCEGDGEGESADDKKKDEGKKEKKGKKPESKKSDDTDPADESDDPSEGDEGDGEGDEGEGDDSESSAIGDSDGSGASGESEGEGGGEDDEADEGSPASRSPDGDIGTGEKSASSAETDETLMDTLERALESIKDYDEALSDALTEKSVEDGKEADYLIYTTDMDVVETLRVPTSMRDEVVRTMTEAVDHMLAPLQKDLERAIAARSAAHWSAGHRTGRLHNAALSKLTAFGDERIFRRKHPGESKDVAVELFVDCSGSMFGSKIRTAAYTAYGLSAVLDRMMINHEVLGFTTSGGFPAEMRAEASRLGVKYSRHETLYHPIIKSFNERMTGGVKRRFASLADAEWLRENVDGESVQFAANRLRVRREKRKILIVLSDGSPACPGNHIAMRAHLKKIVKDVERSGIDVIGIGIEDSSVKHYYSRHVVLQQVADLPTTVIKEIRGLLMTA